MHPYLCVVPKSHYRGLFFMLLARGFVDPPDSHIPGVYDFALHFMRCTSTSLVPLLEGMAHVSPLCSSDASIQCVGVCIAEDADL